MTTRKTGKEKPVPVPATGSILLDDPKLPDLHRLFLIIGMARDEVALTRLLRPAEMNSELEKRCVLIGNPVWVNLDGTVQAEQFYADVSRLVTRQISQIHHLNDRVVGKVLRPELRHIIKAILAVNTIPQATKIFFFGYSQK